MICKTLCLNKKPSEYNKLFFGDYGNFNRIDKVAFPIFRELAELSEGNTWFMNEIDYSKDKKNIHTLDDAAFRMFHLNILYQSAMDSLVPNIFSVLSDLATDSWLSYCYSRIMTEEQIHCLREDDEILTENGWKKLKDLSLEDKVANWWLDKDSEVGTITFENPISIQRQYYNGKMVKWSMNNMEYIVTPKHRVVGYTKRHGDVRWKTDFAYKYSLGGYNFPISGYKNTGKKTKLSFIDRLAIAFQADGSYANDHIYNGAHKTHKGYAYRFNFKKQRKVERFQWILENIKCDYTITKGKNGYTRFYVWIDEKFDKNFDWINLDDITYEWADEFIKELKYWDGSGAKYEKAIRYINTNKKAIDKVMAIASISGYQVGIDDKIAERSKKYKDSKNISKVYCLYLTPKTHKTGRELKKEFVDYSGYIVGVEVPSTYIVVRFSGKHIAITGNSSTYSNGLNEVFGAKATEMLDYIYQDEMLKRRTEKEIEDANIFIDLIFKQEREDDEAKKALLKVLGRAYLLEGVKFPHSFYVTFNINEKYNNAIQGFTQSLLLIAHDEMVFHTTLGNNVIKILLNNEEQGFSHLKDWFVDEFTKMTKETVELEIEWAKYLLQEGAIEGYTIDIAIAFIKYWADFRLKSLKIKPIYNEKKNDTIDWFNAYRNLNKQNIALQEMDNTNYQKGVLTDDLDTLKEFSFDLSKFVK